MLKSNSFCTKNENNGSEFKIICIFANRMWCLFMKSIFWTYEAFTVNDCKTEVKQSSVK